MTLIADPSANLKADSTSTDRVTEVRPGQDAQAALDRAPAGGEVRLLAGEHRGPLWIRRSDVSLRGEGAHLTRIVPGAHTEVDVPRLHDAPPSVVSGVVVHGDDLSGVAVEALTVEGFTGAGVYAHSVSGIRIAGVHAVDDAVWGVYVRESDTVEVRGCRTSGAQYAGVGLSFCPDSRARIADCVSHGNAFGVFVDNSSGAVVDRCTATGNAIGVLMLNQVYEGEPEGGVRDCLVTGCTLVANGLSAGVEDDGLGAAGPPISGVGIGLIGVERVTVVGNEIRGNVPSGPSVMGGALSISSSAAFGGDDPRDVTVTWNFFDANEPSDVHRDDTPSRQAFTHNRFRGSWSDGVPGQP